MKGRQRGSWVAVVALALTLLAVVAAGAALGGRTGTADASSGKAARAVVSLPGAAVSSTFGPIAASTEARLLVAYVKDPDLGQSSTVIERRSADGALDPSFGNGGSVRVRGNVTALAEDAFGGIIYGGNGTIGRLELNGERDPVFDANVPRLSGSFSPTTITFEANYRIVIGGKVSQGARYHAHQGETVVMRLRPDGAPNSGFANDGHLYLGPQNDPSGALGLLPDGSILVAAKELTHLSGHGALLSGTGIKLERGEHSLAIFADGSFAISTSRYSGPGCKVARYEPGGAPDTGFADAGVFDDPGLASCGLTAGPEGELLVRGLVGSGQGEMLPRLELLTVAGAASPSFGGGNGVTLHTPSHNVDATFTEAGGIVVAGGEEAATLTELTADGAADPTFGNAGTVTQPAS
jgi:uncharacterized delta-60 repeat protein